MNKEETGGQPAPADDHKDDQELAMQERLAAMINTRPKAEGVTIDPPQTQLIDDGFWIEKNARTGGWSVKTYIADVPAFLPPESPLAKAAKKKFNDPQNILEQKESPLLSNFPKSFLEKFVSLHEGKTRPVVAFHMELSAEGALLSYKITREVFTNLRKCNHTPLQTQFAPLADVANDWYKLAHKMQESRLNGMADEVDKIVNPHQPGLKLWSRVHKPNHPSELLVQELMRLTNTVAAHYMKKHHLPMPAKSPSSYSETLFKSKDPLFESATDALYDNVIQKHQTRKIPKMRLSSPMRIYGDYIAIQILTRHLDGLPKSAGLAREAKRLSSVFNKAAQGHPSGENKPTERYGKAQRGNDHPFNYLTKHPDDKQSWALMTLASDKRWRRPDVTIRKIYVQGGFFYLVGVQQKAGAAKDATAQGWGVALNYENAREQASFRVLERLNTLAPPPQPKQPDGGPKI